MSDWRKIPAADAAKIMSGGAWTYRDGRLVKVSMDGLAAALQQTMPELLNDLADELNVTAAAFDDLHVEMADDLSAVTVTMQAGDREATTTRQLPPAEVQ